MVDKLVDYEPPEVFLLLWPCLDYFFSILLRESEQLVRFGDHIHDYALVLFLYYFPCKIDLC